MGQRVMYPDRHSVLQPLRLDVWLDIILSLSTLSTLFLVKIVFGS